MSTDATPTPFPRRHDLDALRAGAMLLGIALHGILSFFPVPWAAQDSQQNGIYFLFFAIVHGFRMPLFFMVSGFFTAMLWQRRGLAALIRQRVQRIVIPLLLSMLTIGPAVFAISEWSFEVSQHDTQDLPPPPEPRLIAAVRMQDIDKVQAELDSGEELDQKDLFPGLTPLSWAAMHDNAEIVNMLIEHGADPNERNADGGTPLHPAAMMGRPRMIALLLEHGSDPTAVNARDELAIESTRVDATMSLFFAKMMRVETTDRETLIAQRRKCRELLATDYRPTPTTIRNAYWAVINSPKLEINWSEEAEPFHLFQTPVFFHLWFLWFLCWLVAIFAAIFWLADRFQWKAPPSWLIISPIRYLWIVPLTVLPNLLMGISFPVFGPDTSVGLLPQPHVLLYYALFFGFGALYFNFPSDIKLGRWWWITIPLSIVILFPASLMTMFVVPLTAPLQALFAWAMTFGSIGLCRKVFAAESKTMRYISDSAYWLYLAHLPLTIAIQVWIRNWQFPSIVKFLFVCITVTAILLLVYEFAVRYSWLGTLLNGPRRRPALRAADSVA